MNINSIRFKFIAFNFAIVVTTFILILAITTAYSRKVVIKEREESRKLVNNQIAFSALPMVMGASNSAVGMVQEYLSEYSDLVYCLSISLASKLDFYQEKKDRLWFIKNEEAAREYEEYFDERPSETKVFETDGMLHVISPVHGIPPIYPLWGDCIVCIIEIIALKSKLPDHITVR